MKKRWFMDDTVPVETDITKAKVVFGILNVVALAIIAMGAELCGIPCSALVLAFSFSRDYPITATMLTVVTIITICAVELVFWFIAWEFSTDFSEEWFDELHQ